MIKPVDKTIKSALLFSAVACTTGLLSLALDVLLARSRIPGVFVATWPHLVVGVAAGILSVQLVILVQERHEVVQDRLSKLADMNHHVRNALAIVAFYGTQGSPVGAQLVSEAVKRIEWALREVLPRGWNVSKPVWSKHHLQRLHCGGMERATRQAAQLLNYRAGGREEL